MTLSLTRGGYYVFLIKIVWFVYFTGLISSLYWWDVVSGGSWVCRGQADVEI